jgi:ATP-binding cassette subfamily B multidrug efflux pump
MPLQSHQSLEAFAQDKGHDTAGSLWWRHVRSHPYVYGIGFLSILLVDLADVGIPTLMMHLMDSLGEGRNESQWSWYLLALLFVQFACRIVWRVTLAQQTHVVSAAMKARLWERATYFPWRRLHEDLTPGELMNIAAGDVNNARTIFGFALVTIIDIVFLVIFGAIAMFQIHPTMALTSLGVYLFLIPWLKRVSDRLGTEYSQAQDKLSITSETLAQYLRSIRQEKLFSSFSFWQKLLGRDAKAYQGQREKALRWEMAYVPIAGAGPLVAYLLFLSLGLRFYWDGEMTLGSFVAFQSLLFILQDPLLEIGTCLSESQRAVTSLKRYLKTLRTDRDAIYAAQRTGVVHPPERALSVPSLAIEKLELPFGRSLNVELKAGQKLGVRGPVGSGKSRLLNLIAGLDRSYAGNIQLYGKEIRDAAHDELRERIRFVPQKPFLFSTTLFDNLTLGQKVPDGRLKHVLHICALSEEFGDLDAYLHKPLFEWGQNLSGGQRQRITLARALLKPADLYLFDDCLSAVDQKTEAKILERMREELVSTSVVWTAHRKSTLALCDVQIEWAELK